MMKGYTMKTSHGLCWFIVLGCSSLACTKAPLPDAAQNSHPEESAAEVTLPLRWFGGSPIVDVTINGQGPYTFYFDTGAQGTVLGLDLAEELKLPVVGEGKVSSPGGQGIPSKEVRLDLEIGGLKLHDLPAQAFDRSQLDRNPRAPKGVLSARVFPGYLVTLDYPRDQLLIRKGELPAPDAETIFACDPREPIIAIPMTVAGQNIDVFLDSGAAGGLGLPLSWADRLPLAGKPIEVGRGRRVDREVIIYGAKLQGQVKLGRYVLENPDLRFEEKSVARGIAGNKILRGFALTFDSQNHRVRLEGQFLTQTPARPPRYGIILHHLDQTPLDVASVVPDLPAARAGLQAGDRILHMNGKPVQELPASARAAALADSPLTLVVQRGDQTIELRLSLATGKSKDPS
jgi:hypothetical protein